MSIFKEGEIAIQINAPDDGFIKVLRESSTEVEHIHLSQYPCTHDRGIVCKKYVRKCTKKEQVAAMIKYAL